MTPVTHLHAAGAGQLVEKNEPGSAYIADAGVHWMLNVLIKSGPRDGLILMRAIRRGEDLN